MNQNTTNNEKHNPKQWSPPDSKPDNKCSLLELWSRYCNEIEMFRNFRSKATVNDYTGMLFVIQDALSKRPASCMTAADCWIAVKSVMTWETKSGKCRNYSPSTLSKRITIIRDIYMYAEARAICINPLWYAPWDILSEGGIPDFSLSPEDIRQKLRNRLNGRSTKDSVLTLSQERLLLRKIERNICNDGRWAGLLLYLFLGVRPSEGRDICYGNLVPFPTHPNRRYVKVLGSATSDGAHQAAMKNRFSHRLLPEPIEMQMILQPREDMVKNLIGNSDISKLPIICKENDVNRPCTAVEMLTFAKQQLKDILTEDALQTAAMEAYIEDCSNTRIDDDEDAASANNSITTYALRHLYCTRLHSHAQLPPDKIRLLMGHETDFPTRNPYALDELYEMMLQIDHRMILPKHHPGWSTELKAGTTEADISNVGRHRIGFSDEISQQDVEILIELEAIQAGDSIIFSTNKALPPGAITSTVWTIASAPPNGTPPNRDYDNWSAKRKRKRR